MKHPNKYLPCLLVLLMLFAGHLQAQSPITRVHNIPINIQGATLAFPWAGGLYNPQFYTSDLDFDGDADLVSFDHQGDYFLVFENTPANGQVSSYTFQPALDGLFPDLNNWMILRDFNCDGIDDLISYNPDNGNVLQHTGTQSANGFIEFHLHKNAIYTSDGLNSLPISFSINDRPAFEDIDGDGDLDLLIFNFSDQVDYYANRSMEWYGHCDSLTFEFITDCWGQFDEQQPDYDFALDIECDTFGFASGSSGFSILHSGSSRILPIDYGADGAWDIIAGYGHSRKLGLLLNGGDANEAYMEVVDNFFPENDVEILLPNFPAAYLLDINSNGQKELLITSSFEGKAEDNIWLYQNAGTNANPVWQKEQSNFLQNQMIDVGANAQPTFVDYNLDGLQDLVLSNRGLATGDNANIYISYLSLFRNTGTGSNPTFELVEKDWMNLSALNLREVKVTFGDLDGDGDSDLIMGDYFGKIFYIENIAAAGAEINLDMSNVVDLGFDVGNLACPQLVDVDEDGLLDLLVGEVQGRVFYYNNVGTFENYAFMLTNNFYGSIDVRPPNSSLGFSSPFLFRPAPGQNRILLVGNVEGEVFGYSGVDDQLTIFEPVLPELSIIHTGANAAPAVLYSDDMDQHYLMAGTIRGGVQLYQFTDEISGLDDVPFLAYAKTNAINVFPNPVVGSKATLEFGNVNTPQPGVLYVYNCFGNKVYECPLDLKRGKRHYEVDFFGMQEQPWGLFFLQWVGGKNGSFITGLMYRG